MYGKRRTVGKRARGVAMLNSIMVMGTVGFGVAALAVDTGLMFSARADLQTAVDAAALAAAAELGTDGDVEQAARDAAFAYAEMNKVARNGLTIDAGNDVVMGHANFNSDTGQYDFVPGQQPYDAVQVSGRRAATAADGPVSLIFGHVLGTGEVEISASAVAMLVPRDIAVVVDLSGSMNDDSELRHYAAFPSETGGWREGMQVNIRDIWCAMDGPAPSFPYTPSDPDDSEYADDVGPTVGAMSNWGTACRTDEYDATTDPGLLYLPRNQDWSSDENVAEHVANLGLTPWEQWAVLTNETEGYLTSEQTDSLGFSSRIIYKKKSSSRYEVTVYVSSDSSNSTAALSHLTIGLPSSARSTAASTASSQLGSSASVVSPDSQTGVSGIKFSNAVIGANGVAQTKWFKFEVPSSSGINSIQVASKAGNNNSSRTHSVTDVDPNNTTRWRYRVAVVLGLAEWRSGMAGGISGGDGDGMIESTSECDYINYPSWRDSGWTWEKYIDYGKQTNSMMVQTDSKLLYRFGLKTFVNFLQEKYAAADQTDNLWQTPAQPLQAVKDAVQSMKNKIDSLQSLDHISLETFATSGNHEVNLTDDLQDVPERLYEMQASHYTSSTNIGAGLDKAINELKSNRARHAAAKVIVLMTDGKPNCNQWNSYVGDNHPQAIGWAHDRANYAAENNMTIYTIAVGQDADRDITQSIAAIGRGQEFLASGQPEEYTQQLSEIFQTLGGRRPVQLIK